MARDEILKRLEAVGIKRLVIESRPKYITAETIEICLSHLQTEFAIGLETSNDLIREHVIQKGFTFRDFVEASEAVHRQGGRVKAYLLQKPPLPHGGSVPAGCHRIRPPGQTFCGRSLSQPMQHPAQHPRGTHVGARRIPSSLALVRLRSPEKRAGPNRLRSRGRGHQARAA